MISSLLDQTFTLSKFYNGVIMCSFDIHVLGHLVHKLVYLFAFGQVFDVIAIRKAINDISKEALRATYTQSGWREVTRCFEIWY